MINTKLTLCFCSLFLMTWSCATAENSAYYQGRIKYKNYNGTLISENHEKYPTQVCATTLNETNAYWHAPPFESVCSANITCIVTRTGATVTLELKPETGVMCALYMDYVCLNGTCERLEIDMENQKPEESKAEGGSSTPPLLNFLYLESYISIFRSILPAHKYPSNG